MKLKDIAARLKRLEDREGITDREQIMREADEYIMKMKRERPDVIQITLWSFCELTFDEIKDMGFGRKTLGDYKERWKFPSPEAWRNSDACKPPFNEPFRDIALFREKHGDLEDGDRWMLTWGVPYPPPPPPEGIQHGKE